MTLTDDTREFVAPLIRWFEEAHPELIGEGSAVDNAIRLLDWAYVGVCEDPERLSAHAIKARGRRGDDPAARAADAIADLADTLTGFRELIEREEARMRKRDADEDAREGRRAAAEWQEGLIAVESFLRGVRFDVQVTRKDIEVTSDIEKIIVNVAPDGVKAIVAELDKRLRSSASWSLQRGLQTLGGRPPKDLRAEAEAFADRNGADGPARVAAIEAYLAGAGVER